MIVSDNDGNGFVLNGRIKHFSWVYQTLIECTDTDSMRTNNSTSTIESDGDEVFTVEMMILFEMIISFACSCYDGVFSDTVIA